MKKIFLGCILLLLLTGCTSTEEQTTAGQSLDKCGDGTCDQAEQADATLCPKDCDGEIENSIASEQKTETTQKIETIEDTTSYAALSDELAFIPDDGIRMEDASNPGAKVNTDGTISLLYEDRSDNAKQRIATSDDGLTFEEGDVATREEAGAFRAKQLPDSTWIGYGYDTTKGIEGNCLTSQSSEDGVTFTQDSGCRYTLQEDDEGTMGVYDFFADSEDNIVLLYIGDLYGLNNVRRAYSTDNGNTFTFTNDNVLGDEEFGGGAKSYVDEKVLVLSDNRVLLIAMKQGTIYGFISEDDGVTFQRFEEPLLEAEDFAAVGDGTLTSLHDPQIVQLEDGNYRIYVTGNFNKGTESRDDDIQSIVSATTATG